MTHSFDSAVPALLWVVEHDAAFESLETTCLVRDVTGRLRLIVKPAGSSRPDLGPLEAEISRELGAWFAGPVLSSSSERQDVARLARGLLEQATEWPEAWPVEGKAVAGSSPITRLKWRALQRSLSKQSWLTTSLAEPPWPLVSGVPAIVSFSSFKGGVGRSTALAAVAFQLSKGGKRVVCIDLDLEAPGLGALFSVKSEGGVLDYLLTRLATGRTPVEDPAVNASLLGVDLLVVPAGVVDLSFVEKLARLDFLSYGNDSSGDTSPVEAALKELLQHVKRLHRPDYILLDCRAGVSDIGGLSLNDLPHVDVLVGRAGAQWDSGLDLSLQVLTRRRRRDERRIVVAQTFVPLPLAGEESQGVQRRHRRSVHEAFTRRVWSDESAEGEIPAEDDTTSAHFPVVIGRYDELANAETLASVSEIIFANDAFTNLRSRIEAVAAPEPAGGTRTDADEGSRA